jgi:hypothetical protein
MERGRSLKTAPIHISKIFLKLFLAEMQPRSCTADKRHKHNGNDGFSPHPA